MRLLESSFIVDLLSGLPAAVDRAKALQVPGADLGVPAPCLAELYRGVGRAGGRGREALDNLIAQLEVVPLDEESARLAGALAAETSARGREVSMMDCLVAGISLARDGIIVSRDTDFARIPGLSIETY